MTVTAAQTQLYLNGSPDSGGGGFTDGSNSEPMLIGTSFSTDCNTELDEVQIFGRALVQSEIQAIYNADGSGKCKCEPLPDGSACTQTGCPGSCECVGGANDGITCSNNCDGSDCPGGICEQRPPDPCVPVCARVVPSPGLTTVIDCDCQPQDTCHVEIDAAGDASCVGDCPPGLECVQTITEGPGYIDVCCSCEPPCLPAPSGIAHWWPLDEPTGPTAQDTISGADGTHIDGPTPVPGFVAGALSTGGLTGGHVDVPDGPPTLDIDLTAPPFGFTVAFWYKCSDDPACITLPGGKQTAVSKWDATTGVGYILDVGPGGYCWQTGDVVAGGNGL